MECEQMNKVQDKIRKLLESKGLTFVLGAFLLVTVVYLGRETFSFATGKNVRVVEDVKCVVIDAGHGGGR